MLEEAEALLHCSRSTNKALKTCVTLLMQVIIGIIQFVCLDIVIGTMTTGEIFVGLVFDNLSLLVGMILFGLYTNLPDQAVQILGAMPFLFMIFFSTTFSPGSGVEGVKGLRYLFSRFYLWCMLPVDMGMEGCPESNTLLYLILSSLFMPFVFVVCKVGIRFGEKFRKEKKQTSRREAMKTMEFAELQVELFGETALRNLSQVGTSVSRHEMKRIVSAHSMAETAQKGSEDASGDEAFDNFVSFLNEGSGGGPSEKTEALLECVAAIGGGREVI